MISLLYPDALLIADCARQHRARQFSIMTAIHDVEDKKDAKIYLASIDASLAILEKELVQDRRALTGLDKAKEIIGGQQTSNGAAMANCAANIGVQGLCDKDNKEQLNKNYGRLGAWPVSDPGDC